MGVARYIYIYIHIYVLNLQELQCAGGVTWEVAAFPPLGQELGIFTLAPDIPPACDIRNILLGIAGRTGIPLANIHLCQTLHSPEPWSL